MIFCFVYYFYKVCRKHTLQTNNVTCDAWHVTSKTFIWHITHDMWHVTYDICKIVWAAHSIKMSALYLYWFGSYDVLKIRRKRMSQSVSFPKKDAVFVWTYPKIGLTPPSPTKSCQTFGILFFFNKPKLFELLKLFCTS